MRAPLEMGSAKIDYRAMVFHCPSCNLRLKLATYQGLPVAIVTPSELQIGRQDSVTGIPSQAQPGARRRAIQTRNR